MYTSNTRIIDLTVGELESILQKYTPTAQLTLPFPNNDTVELKHDGMDGARALLKMTGSTL